MRQTFEKVMILEILSLVLSILLGFVALFQTSVILLISSFYMLAISLACDAYSHEYTTYRQFQGRKQLVRAVVVFFLATTLIFLL